MLPSNGAFPAVCADFAPLDERSRSDRSPTQILLANAPSTAGGADAATRHRKPRFGISRYLRYTVRTRSPRR
jgi:hypothetical protein